MGKTIQFGQRRMNGDGRMDEYLKYVAVERLKALEKELGYKGNDDLRLPHLDYLRKEVHSELDRIEKSE